MYRVSAPSTESLNLTALTGTTRIFYAPLTAPQCAQFNDALGRRPYDWDKRIAKDRKPSDSLWHVECQPPRNAWLTGTGTTHLHEKVYVTRPNNPSIWQQFTADPCVGTPCDNNVNYLGHGVDQLRYDRYAQDFRTPVFCLDQLNTIEEGVQKMAAIAEGYKKLPEIILSDFRRLYTLRKAGTNATQSGLWLAGVQDASGNPVAIDVTDNMFSVAQGQSGVTSNNTLFINLNANAGLTALGITTTALLQSNMGQLTMEYLKNNQTNLAANGYHEREWLMAGKFSITTDADTRSRLLVANPALTNMYSAADFAKGGAFYSLGVTAGAGDWLFKEDKEQMRFRFRGDMDGKDFLGNALSGAIWIEQIWPFQNVAASYGLKPVFSNDWKIAPIRLYHVYNREARTTYVGDVTSINPEMKFGLARSLVGKWKWYSPVYFQATDPNTGFVCSYDNHKMNKGFWEAEFNIGMKTVYPECEMLILGLGEPQPYVRKPNTTTPPVGPLSNTDYQSNIAYIEECGDAYINPGFSYPIED